jgi:glycosyltransferase involved in cell wall biosynthesis
MIRVVYWNNIPAPYMVERFNAVSDRAKLDFEVWFSSRTKSWRSWNVDESSWRFAYRYLPAIGRGDFAIALPRPLFDKRVPDVLVSLYAGPDFLVGSGLARRRGARTAFWVEHTFESWFPRRMWKEVLKSRLLPRADAILAPGPDGRDFAMRYGVLSDRVFFVPHVVDIDHYQRRSRLDTVERARVREAYGLLGVTFVYVGRLLPGKGLDYLVDAFAALQRRSVTPVSLLLVGDGDGEGALRERCAEQDVKNVVFAGFHDSDSLPAIYAAADVFVFPTLGDTFGLVVSEAMACELPVIATTATGEIGSRVEDGVNGFLVPPADSDALLERMTLLTDDRELRRQMGAASAEKVAGQTPELWAQAFECAIERTVSMPRARDARPRAGRIRRAVGDHTS